MKFDFCIGNPPYQDNTLGDNANFAPPVYNKFMDAAFENVEKVELIHPARFLFNAGSTPKDWNGKMLNDPHFKILEYEQDSSKIFPNTDIKGGIVISYHDNKANYGAIEVFSAYSELNSIRHKVLEKSEPSLMSTIYVQNRFDLSMLYEDYPELKNVIGSDGKDKRFRNNIFEKISLFSEIQQNEDDIKTIGVLKNKRVWRYLPIKYFDKNHENYSFWKVLVPRASGSGKFGEPLSTLVIGEPFIAYTQTFIGVGAFELEEEALSAMKYLKTKFVRTMLGLLKITQDNDREAWKYVPLQDFTSNSDIDWNVSIANIDRQLYKKYGLSVEEIEFIETHVKEME